uniref:Phytanoyl-CoA dioxygenase n=1 Tax=Entomoneis paludosa TaxID=265537 RepID=A0A7S2YG24_9STRA|mmetsp:Transcript_31612/g.66060  ORF Transcript_31612/g.66060 Transcript_31612/m.66060 type:complete len:357 (+) Transcript_31612:1181-2251(+)
MLEVPLDEEDWRYHQSFTVQELEQNDSDGSTNSQNEALDFFQCYGFVIVRDVISHSPAILEDMLDLLQEQDGSGQLDRNDPSTWKNLSRFGMPTNGSKALFRPALLRLRQDRNICRAFGAVLQADYQSDIICGHDRWLLHRPNAATTESKPWSPSPKNVHLDLNPYAFDNPDASQPILHQLSQLRYNDSTHKDNLGDFISENMLVHNSMGLCVQGLINLLDLPLGGPGSGTIVIPGSHVPGQWPPLRPPINAAAAAHGASMQYRCDDDWASRATNVALRPGSLLIWNQRLIHGSTPNRQAHQLRAAVPLRFFHKTILRQQPARAARRAATIRKQLNKCQFPDELTPLGRSVFGLTL